MATFSTTLTEQVLFQDLEINNAKHDLFESSSFNDSLVKSTYKSLVETASFSDSLPFGFTFFKSLNEGITFLDVLGKYTQAKHATFDVEIYRNGTPLSVDKGDVIRFEFTKSLTEQVGGGWIVFENADTLDYRAGDEIRFYYGSESSGLNRLIFTGEIDSVEKQYDEEEAQQLLRLDFLDWGKILLEKKIDKSYPTVTNANTIIIEILSDVSTSNDPPYSSERKINISHIASTYKTRTADFVGESLWDCLKKLAFITESEFYVDQNKRLQFFPKNQNVLGETLTIEDFIDYKYRTKEDMIANTVKVFGNASKFSEDYDPDVYTETSASYWSDDGSSGTLLAGPKTLPTGYAVAGDQVISYTRAYGTTSNGSLSMKCLFGKEYDLTLKQAYSEIVFDLLCYPGSDQRANSLNVYLIDGDDNKVWIKAHKFNFMWWQPTSMIGDHVEFQEFRIPVGPLTEEEGKWELVSGSPDFDWKRVKGISFQACFKISGVGSDQVNLWVDNLHFDKGKWYGVYSDSTSMQDPPDGHGIRYKEIFDDTIFSDVAAQRWAKEYIIKYKDPIDFLYESQIFREDIEFLNPGDIFSVNVPELGSTYKDFKIRDITFKYSEEDFFEIVITLEEAL